MTGYLTDCEQRWAEGVNTKAKGFPKVHNALSRHLNKLKVTFAKSGITIENLQNVGAAKLKQIRITKSNEETSSTSSTTTIPEAGHAQQKETMIDDEEGSGDDDRDDEIAIRDDVDDVLTPLEDLTPPPEGF